MEIRIHEKELMQWARESGTLEGLEIVIRGLTEKERNECTAGELADRLLRIIENGRMVTVKVE